MIWLTAALTTGIHCFVPVARIQHWLASGFALGVHEYKNFDTASQANGIVPWTDFIVCLE
jgi:hypothetical protein